MIYNKLVKNISLPLSDFFMGTSINKNLNFLKKSEWFSLEALQKNQNKSLRNILRYSYREIPYYNKLFKSINLRPEEIKTSSDLKKIPILNKDIIRENYNDFFPIGFNTSNSKKSQTGGSTGNPLSYYRSWSDHSWSKAVRYRAWSYGGHQIGNKVMTLAGSSLTNSNPTIKHKILYNLIERTRKLSAFDMSEERMHEYYSSFKDYNPHHFRGYANSLFEFSNFINRNDYNLDGVKSVFSAAEKLDSEKRPIIEKAFNAKVFDNYGAGDGSAFANECEIHSGLHMDMEVGVIEFLNKGENVEEDYGDIVSTSLINYDFPLIRYEVGDIGKPTNEKCVCGRFHTLIDEIVGRNHDFIKAGNGKLVHGEFFSHLVRKHIPEILQFQVHQKSLNYLEMKIRTKIDLNSDKISHIRKIIEDKVGSSSKVSIKIVDEIKPSSSGKWKFIISDI